jgi:phosphopantetheinyl transferase
MPMYFRKYLLPEGEVGIWEIAEEEAFFSKRLLLTRAEKDHLKKIKGQGRRLQWLSSRYLLHYLSGRKVRGSLYKDEYGKPHLTDSPYQISLSHSHEMAAVMAAPVPIGIDIQIFVPKIGRLAHKYMREAESKSLKEETTLEHLHVYWCAKEAVYKAYGRRELDFRKNIIVTPFAYEAEGCQFEAKIVKPELELELHYQLCFEKFGDYYLVYCWET